MATSSAVPKRFKRWRGPSIARSSSYVNPASDMSARNCGVSMHPGAHCIDADFVGREIHGQASIQSQQTGLTRVVRYALLLSHKATDGTDVYDGTAARPDHWVDGVTLRKRQHPSRLPKEPSPSLPRSLDRNQNKSRRVVRQNIDALKSLFGAQHCLAHVRFDRDIYG